VVEKIALGINVEIVQRVWLGGVNPPEPFLRNEYSGVRFLPIESLAKFLNEFRPDDIVLISDVNRLALECLRRTQGSRKKSILIRNEPKVVCPNNYNTRTTNQFDQIVDIGRQLPDTSFTMPYSISWPSSSTLSDHLEKAKHEAVVFMNSNKLSFIQGELYSLRRQTLKSQDITLFGPGWDSSALRRLKILLAELVIAFQSKQKFSWHATKYWFSRYANYMGLAENKLAALSNFKVALTIENSADYMSEKLMDALLAGCIPVYVGPETSSFEIPDELVYRAGPNLESIKVNIELALAADLEDWRTKATVFLANEKTRIYWSQSRIYEEIIRRTFGFSDA
jgi:hypothetical protein